MRTGRVRRVYVVLRRAVFFSADEVVDREAQAIAIGHRVNEQEQSCSPEDREGNGRRMEHAEVEHDDERNQEEHAIQ